MKKSILAVLMLISVSIFFVSCKDKPKEEVVVETVEATGDQMAMNDVYMCDMKCKAYSEPGNCECGMELKKVEPAVDSTVVEENHDGHDH